MACFAVALGLACARREPPPRAHATHDPRPRPDAGGAGGGAVATETTPALEDRVAACAHRLDRTMPPELARALGALDDDTTVTDACRLDVAVDALAPGVCAAISLHGLRDTCLARAAMALGRPDRCPEAMGLRGHDPTCVAIASRHRRLCLSANVTDRGRCLALASGDVHGCDDLDALVRPACVRDVSALAGRLPVLPQEPQREGTTAALVTGGGDGAAPEEFALRTTARGVLLGDDGALWIMDSTRPWPTLEATANDLPVPAVRIPLQGAHPGVDLPAEARVLWVGGGMLDTMTQATHAVARLNTIPTHLGDTVRGTVRVDGVLAGDPVTFVLDVDTFVRDFVAAAALR